jgi:hypothetical protein
MKISCGPERESTKKAVPRQGAKSHRDAWGDLPQAIQTFAKGQRRKCLGLAALDSGYFGKVQT